MAEITQELLTERQAAEYIGLSARFLQARRSRGDSPPWVRISQTCVRYKVADLDDWITAHTVTNTADGGK